MSVSLVLNRIVISPVRIAVAAADESEPARAAHRGRKPRVGDEVHRRE
jgi:hypothetical protein